MNDFQKIKRLINWNKNLKISVELKDIEGMVIAIDGQYDIDFEFIH